MINVNESNRQVAEKQSSISMMNKQAVVFEQIRIDRISRLLAAPNAMHFPCGIGPFGMPSGGNGPSPGGDWGLRWCGMYAAMPLIWEYEYFQNATFGHLVLYPILSGLADYWRCWLEREPDGKCRGTF